MRAGDFVDLQAETLGTFLPRFGPPEGNTVRPACLGLISMGCYKREIALARKAKAIVGCVFSPLPSGASPGLI